MDEQPPQPEMIEKEKYLRLAADFENYKRAQTSEAIDARKFASQRVIVDMLNVADMLDQAIAHVPAGIDEKWFEGLRKIRQRFADDIAKYEAKRIETVGKPFDPVTMEAVQTKPPDSPEQADTVAAEVQAGYTMHERVIRPARVIIYQ